MRLIYPGSFDPVSYGHLDIIERSSKITDSLVVAVLTNQNKKPLFTPEERRELIRGATKHLTNVEVVCYDGLLVDLFKKYQIDAIVKGLRAISDFEYEFQMAQINRQMNSSAETLFMMTSPKFSYLSSSMVREISLFGGNISDFVPPNVVEAMKKKMEEK
ncbi:pantetheine-phosphate adenylyltransferase [Guggenheimella bovis]